MSELNPITRVEEYLPKLAGEDVPVPEPITREEKFLAYIAGEADTKPIPITRKEKFLDAIEQGGGGTLIEKTITTNGTYNASSDNADGYSKVTVNVPQGAVGAVYAKNMSNGSITIDNYGFDSYKNPVAAVNTTTINSQKTQAVHLPYAKNSYQNVWGIIRIKCTSLSAAQNFNVAGTNSRVVGYYSDATGYYALVLIDEAIGATVMMG